MNFFEGPGAWPWSGGSDGNGSAARRAAGGGGVLGSRGDIVGDFGGDASPTGSWTLQARVSASQSADSDSFGNGRGSGGGGGGGGGGTTGAAAALFGWGSGASSVSGGGAAAAVAASPVARQKSVAFADSALELRTMAATMATVPGHAAAKVRHAATQHDFEVDPRRPRDQEAAATAPLLPPPPPGGGAVQRSAAEVVATPLRARVRAGLYVAMNIAATVSIVFANKIVLSTYGFSFPVFLTLLHALATAAGMELMRRAGAFAAATHVPAAGREVLPVAAAYVASIVLSNWSIQANTVGFYQLCKVLITPTLIAVERVWLGRRPSGRALAATGVLLLGIAVATLFDKQLASNAAGAAVGLASTLASAVYQALASHRQRSLGLDASQLLHLSMPPAALMLAVLAPMVEPLGLPGGRGGGGWAARGTLLGYEWSVPAALAVLGSAALG